MGDNAGGARFRYVVRKHVNAVRRIVERPFEHHVRGIRLHLAGDVHLFQFRDTVYTRLIGLTGRRI